MCIYSNVSFVFIYSFQVVYMEGAMGLQGDVGL